MIVWDIQNWSDRDRRRYNMDRRRAEILNWRLANNSGDSSATQNELTELQARMDEMLTKYNVQAA